MLKTVLIHSVKLLSIVAIFSCTFLCCSPEGDATELTAEGQKNLTLGKKALQDKNIERALELFSKVIQSDPAKVDGYYHRGSALLMYTKKAREAVFDLSKAIEIDSTFADAYNNRGLASSYTGAINSSMDDFEKALKLDPNFTQAYINRGSCHLHWKQYPLALNDFTKAIELQPDNPETYYQRGLTFYRQKVYDSAIVDFSKSISIGYNLEVLFQKRGNAFFKLGQFDKAIEDYNKVIEMNPNNFNARNNLAVSLDTTGNAKDAKVHREFLAEAAKNQKIQQKDELLPFEKIKFKSFVSESGYFGVDLPETWHVKEKRGEDNITLLITKDKLIGDDENYLVGAKLVLQDKMSERFNIFKQDSLLEFWLGSTLQNSEDYFDYQIFQKKTLQKGPYKGFLYKTLIQVKEDQVPLRLYEYILARDNMIFYAYLQAPDEEYDYYLKIFDKAFLKIWLKDINSIE